MAKSPPSTIPTEPIGSIPRPADLRVSRGESEGPNLADLYEDAVRDVRRLLRLTRGPFRYKRYADLYLDVAIRFAHVPIKQTVISPSACSLMHPVESIPDYSRGQFRGRR